MASNEEEMESSLKQYRFQLTQVEETLKFNCSEDLSQLKFNLLELIQLTEESLLSLKKSSLLALVDNLAALADEDLQNEKSLLVSEECSDDRNGSSSVEEDDDSDDDNEDVNDSSNELIGMKCRVPFSHEWGGMSYHNALISSIESPREDGNEMVGVLFCNPTHKSMKLCTYYMNGFCKFEDTKCRYSHGHLITLSDIKPFEEPNYDNIRVGGKCLAKDLDELWYKATIVDIIDKNKIQVMFADDDCLSIKELHDIYPVDDSNEENKLYEDDDDEVSEAVVEPSVQIRDFNILTHEVLGQWEQHTKGIGSKLMLKMGYIVGQGLGKNSDGRAIPVPMEILPQGKSLDKIMELREKHQNAFKPKLKTSYGSINSNKKREKSVFDVINSRLSTPRKSGNLKKSKTVRHITTQELSKKSDQHINIQLLKTSEELRKSNFELLKLKDSLARNISNRDEITAEKIRVKITNLQEYQERLMISEKFMDHQKKSRKAQKELTSF